MSTTLNKGDYEELEFPKGYRTEGFKEPVWVHMTNKIELVENVGALRYKDGAEYPEKGIPSPDGVYAVNIIKSILKEGFRISPYLFFANKNKILTSFNTVTNRILKPTVKEHVAVPYEYLCPTAFSIYSIIGNFLVNIGINEHIAENTAYNIAHIFEHDDAWRYRYQDMATEININDLFDNPRKELKRLIAVFNLRQDITPNIGAKNVVAERVEHFVTVIGLLLLIPKYKSAFYNIIRFIKMAEYDDADWYWARLRNDYNYKGLPVEERMKGVVFPKKYLIAS